MSHIPVRNHCRYRSDENLRCNILIIYSVSDSSLANAFFIIFVANRLPCQLGKPLWSTKSCINEHTFCLNSAKS